ncbi:putative phosphatidate phosphatase [Selaginella moellendorffii]|uniref:putative phosphatidate phosphatase n=1 Tax=Selaginella moellendorffii TaxID=88036 RepID=UPI000D1CE2B3|nr:putative phosphatidate phosphatase [Selaginella moellendorffii]|eukprot:XP_024532126.1 putative phosphatidate phosphatase [Selaginella moellendorffii]
MNEYMINDLRFPVKSFTVPIAALVVRKEGSLLAFSLSSILIRLVLHGYHHLRDHRFLEELDGPTPARLLLEMLSRRRSGSFAGLGYLSWYLAGRIKFAGHRGRIIKFVIAALPLVGATLVAISIMNDYWHHWSDVVAGAVIGTILCSILREFLTAVALSQVWSLERCATGSNSR